MHDGHHHHHHDHDHAHDHSHDHGGFTAAEEAFALLKYMAEHNKVHAGELELMTDQIAEISQSAADELSEAVELYKMANAKLDHVVEVVAPAGQEEAASEEETAGACGTAGEEA